MPEQKSPQESDALQIELLTKYGVYAIMFGGDLLRAANQLHEMIPEKYEPREPMWVVLKLASQRVLIANAGRKSSTSPHRRQLLQELLRASELAFRSENEHKRARNLYAGALDALKIDLLCEKLSDISRAKNCWWNEFKALPAVRDAGLVRPAVPNLLYRHALHTDSTRDKRFIGSKWSMALDSFVRALDSATPQPSANGRLFVLLAPRGTGKGQLWSVLKKGLENRKRPMTADLNSDGQTLWNLWSILNGKRDATDPWVALFNLGFSLEVSSVIDRVARFLWDFYLAQVGSTSKEVEWSSFRHDRLRRLRFVLKCVEELEEDTSRPRPLIVVNAANVLLDSEGRGKNSQIDRVVRLVCKSLKKARIDLVLIQTPDTIPEALRIARVSSPGRSLSGKHWLQLLVDPNRTSASKARDAEWLRTHGIAADASTAGSAWAFVHWVRPVHASAIIAALYPRTAWAIARRLRNPGGADAEPVPKLLPQMLERGVQFLTAGERSFQLSDPQGGAKFSAHLGSAKVPVEPIDSTELEDQDPEHVESIDRYCRRLHRAAGRGRWPLTLLLSAVEASLSSASASEVCAGLDEWCVALERLPPDKRVAHVVTLALACMREYLSGAQQSHVSAMCDAILWHLSVIGEPTELDALCACPYVRSAAHVPAEEPTSPGGSAAVQADVEQAIDRLLERGLIFEMEPSQTGRLRGTIEGEPAARPPGDIRYCVHRLMQRHVLGQLGGPLVEKSDVDRLSLSLYVSQPNDMAALRPDVHQRVSTTVEMLTGYPDHDSAAVAFDHQEPKTKPQLLRAAFGI